TDSQVRFVDAGEGGARGILVDTRGADRKPVGGAQLRQRLFQIVPQGWRNLPCQAFGFGLERGARAHFLEEGSGDDAAGWDRDVQLREAGEAERLPSRLRAILLSQIPQGPHPSHQARNYTAGSAIMMGHESGTTLLPGHPPVADAQDALGRGLSSRPG